MLRDLVGERIRFAGDDDWRSEVVDRAERGVAAGCGGLGEGGARRGASELVIMIMSRVLGNLARVFA